MWMDILTEKSLSVNYMSEENLGEVAIIQFKNVKLLRLNVPNKNGVVYTKECIEKATKNFTDEQRIIVHNVYAEKPLPIGLTENFRIEDDLFVCDCLFNPNFIKLIEGQTVNIRPIGHGVFDDTGKLEDYSISGFTVVYQPKV